MTQQEPVTVADNTLPLVTLDRYVADLGLVAGEPEQAKLVEERLRDAAYEFFKGGGAVGWQDWLSMGVVTRRAFTQARQLVDEERLAHSLSSITQLVGSLTESSK